MNDAPSLPFAIFTPSVCLYILSGQLYSFIILKECYKRKMHDSYYAYKYHWLFVALDIWLKHYYYPFQTLSLEHYIYVMDGITILSIISVLLIIHYLLPFEILNRNIRKVPIKGQNHLIVAILVILCNCVYVYFNVEQLNKYFFTGVIFNFRERPFFIYSITFVLSTLCIYTYFVAMQLLRYHKIKKDCERKVTKKYKSAPIVMLRSFMLDYGMINGCSFDEYISKKINFTETPIVALADPNDPYPSGGSIKIQTSDEGWQTAISAIMKESRAVVLFEGESNGLKWEMSNIRDVITPNAFFIAIPPLKYKQKIWLNLDLMHRIYYTIFKKEEMNRFWQSFWIDFANQLSNRGIVVPELYPGDNTIIRFDDNWVAKQIVHYKNFSEAIAFMCQYTESKTPYAFIEALTRLEDSLLKYSLPEWIYRQFLRVTWTAACIPAFLCLLFDMLYNTFYDNYG